MRGRFCCIVIARWLQGLEMSEEERRGHWVRGRGRRPGRASGVTAKDEVPATEGERGCGGTLFAMAEVGTGGA